MSRLPAHLAKYNATYAPTGALVDGFPTFSAGPTRHLLRDPKSDQWHLTDKPFDPAADNIVMAFATIPAAGGPVPTGARAWTVVVGGEWVQHEVTAREVA